VGDVPFRAPSPAAVLVKHFSEELPPPDRACPGVSQPASRLVSIMMAKNPGARFQTPDELLAAVQEAIAGTAPRGPAVQDDTMSYASLGASGSGSLTSLTRTVQVVSTEVKSVGRSRFFVVAAVLSLAISAVAIGVLASQNSPEDGGQPVPTWMEDDEAAPKPGEPLPPAKGSASPGTGPERPSPPEAPAEKPASDLGEFSREVDQIKDQLKDVRSLIEALQRKYERSGGKPAKADLEAGRKLQDTIERLEKELKDTSKRLNSILKK